MCDLVEKCGGYSSKNGCNDFDNYSAGNPTCFIEIPLTTNKDAVADVPCNDGLSRQLDYWKTRCMRAEEYIKESPCDPDIYEEQRLAYKRWQDKVAEIEPAA